MIKPPVFRSIKNAYKFVFGHFRVLLWCAVPYFTCAVLLSVCLTFGVDDRLEQLNWASFIFLVWVIIPLGIASFIYGKKAVMGWYRVYVQDEITARDHSRFVVNIFEWEFVCKGIVLLILQSVVVLLAALFGVGIFFAIGAMAIKTAYVVYGVSIATLLAVLGGLALMIIPARVVFYFPAKATGRYISFKESYRLSAGLGHRLVLTIALALLPVAVVEAIFGFVVKWFGTSVMFLLEKSIDLIFVNGFLLLSLSTAVVSEYYIWIRDNRIKD